MQRVLSIYIAKKLLTLPYTTVLQLLIDSLNDKHYLNPKLSVHMRRPIACNVQVDV